MHRINKLIYQLANGDDMSDASLWHDPCLIMEWTAIDFQELPRIRRSLMFVFIVTKSPLSFDVYVYFYFTYRNPDNSNFNFVYKPFDESNTCKRSLMVYVCMYNSINAQIKEG